MFDNFQARNTSFVINYTGDEQDVTAILPAAKAARLRDDYTGWSVVSPAAKITGGPGAWVFAYTVGYHATLEQEQAVSELIKRVTPELVTGNKTDLEKITAINNYITAASSYDSSLTKRSAYHALIEGSAVCQGYALAMDKMLETAGFNTKLIDGNLHGGIHIWNLVQLDGNWYHVDVTNNDPTNNKYLLVSDSFMLDNKFTWDSSEFPAAPKKYVATVTEPPVTAPPVTEERSKLLAATALVADVEMNYTPRGLAVAVDAVNSLVDSAVRKELTERLVAIQRKLDEEIVVKALANAAAAVGIAERSVTLATIEAASKLVQVLPAGTEKDRLNDILTALRTKLPVSKEVTAATKAVVMAEKYPAQSYLNSARKLVTALPDSIEKSSLVQRITAVDAVVAEQVRVKALAAATLAVEQAERNISEYYVNRASGVVSALQNEADKQGLVLRLASVKDKISQAKYVKQLADATTAVVSMEKYKSASSLTKAVALVEILTESPDKQLLKGRISSVKAGIDQAAMAIATKNATSAISLAEKYKNSSYLSKAQTLINKLPAGTDKDNLNARALSLKSRLGIK